MQAMNFFRTALKWSRRRCGRRERPVATFCSVGLGITVAAILVGAVILARGAERVQATINTAATPLQLAQAIAADPGVVTGAAYGAVPPGGTPNAVSDTPLTSFPTNGSTYAILTTGGATLAPTPNTASNSGADAGGVNVRGDTDYDVTILRIDLSVPSGINCLVGIDFQFLSEEYSEYVGSSFNDAFIAELDSSTWTTSGSTISAPNNFAFDPVGNVISVNAAGVTSMTAASATGTTYDGATPRLTAATPITAGAHSLFLSIFDQDDHIYDSAVFLDDLRFGTVANVETDCVPGAVVPPTPTPTNTSTPTPTATATPTANCAPPLGLVACWKLDENGGTTAFDSSGNANDGTLINGPSWTPGHSGSALSFDGVNDYVSVPDASSLDLAGPFTLMAWVKPDSSVGCFESFVNKYNNYGLQTCSSDRLRMFFSGSSFQVVETSDGILVPNVWQQITGTWDGSTARLYRNGVEVAQMSPGAMGLISTDIPLLVGAEMLGSPWEFFGGVIDEVRIWNRALSANEVAAAAGSTVSVGGIAEQPDVTSLPSAAAPSGRNYTMHVVGLAVAVLAMMTAGMWAAWRRRRVSW